MKRRPLIAGNWKMHKTIGEAIDLSVRLKYASDSIDDRDVVVCPPYPSIQAVSETFTDSEVEVGAQDMHYEDEGAYTGEVSPLMIQDAGADWVILGHSERREYFNEDAGLLQQKLSAAAEHDFKVFYCIGESEEERENDRVEEVLGNQIESVLSGFQPGDFNELVIAYEPLWAIGTGNPATPDQANDAHETVRERLEEVFSTDDSRNIRVVYGGSVKPHNAEDLLTKQHIDGALVGGASLSAEDFASIIKYNLDEDVEIPSL